MDQAIAPAPSRATEDLPIAGMTCAACASRIEKALNRLPGVHAAVNVATERAPVEYDAVQTRPEDLVAAIRKAGYDAHEISGERRAAEKARRAAAYRRDLSLFWISAALTLPLLAQMAFMFSGRSHDLLPHWLQLTLATPVQFWVGRRFYIGS